jgi:alpha,alpha-trehalase
MKKIFFVAVLTLVFFLQVMLSFAQHTPDKVYEWLFTDVQNSTIFSDSKTFVDCTPKRNYKQIVADYLVVKLKENFSLKDFVNQNFEMPQTPTAFDNIQKEKNVVTHITNLWQVLKREKDKKVEGSSLLPLPKPYIVPGGRFREIYYWDSYFTMLGLKESGEVQLIENMIDNFAYLIHTYGHIPNGIVVIT